METWQTKLLIDHMNGFNFIIALQQISSLLTKTKNYNIYEISSTLNLRSIKVLSNSRKLGTSKALFQRI